MTPEPAWERVEELLARALDLGADERRQLLDRECVSEPELRAEVESLLDGQSRARSFLDPDSSPVHGLGADGEAPDDDRWIGRTFGGYELREAIGAGGMGRVYEAWQEHPGRSAAVKVLRPLAGGTDVRRFEYEAAVLAKLRHPAVAHLYASGLVEDPGGGELPWFAMELVPGALPVTTYAREYELDRDARIELFLAVCDGVQHAHQRGVLHRDLKPSNLLVDRDGRPRIIDFGIARTFGEDLELTHAHTRTGEFLGTLQYMSPQQCSAADGEVDIRSDVYSLGLVLYELLTGVVAQDLGDTTLYEALRIIREKAPPRPSSIDPSCRGDLETIVMKAIEKDADRRYESVGELAAELRRFRRREPILARPPGLVHRIRLTAARNPLAAIALVLFVVALVGGTTASTVFAVREGRAARDATRQARVAVEVNRFLNDDVFGAADPMTNPDPDLRVRDVLRAAGDKIEGRFPDEPLVEAGVRTSVGSGLLSLGLYDDALPHLERAVELKARELGERHERTVSTRTALARCVYRRGDHAEAGRLTADLLRDVDDGAERGRALSIRAALLASRGDSEGAYEAWKESHDLLVAAEGEAALESLVVGNGVAEALRKLGRLEEAEALHREHLALAGPALGDDHPHLFGVQGNLALVLQDGGRLDEARVELEGALAGMISVLGPSHDKTLVARRNLALVCLQLRRIGEAEEHAEEALDGYRSTLGDDHHRTLGTLLVLAQIRTAQGRADDAEPMLWEVIEGAWEHPAIVQEASLYLSRALLAKGDDGAAVELLEATVAGAPADGFNETVLALENQLGMTLMKLRRLEDAEPILGRVAGAMRDNMGTHMGTGVSLRNHGRCLRDLGRTEEARAVLEEAHAVFVDLVGEENPMTITVGREVAALPPPE